MVFLRPNPIILRKQTVKAVTKAKGIYEPILSEMLSEKRYVKLTNHRKITTITME